MPGFLSSVVYVTSAFLLGILLVNQIVDYDLLFAHPLPAESLNKAFAYYQTWWDSPVAVKALLHAAALAPVLALAIKLNAWTESAIFFDGSSLALQVVTLILYLTVHIPSFRTFLPSGGETDEKSIWTFIPAAPAPEVPATFAEKTDAIRVLAAGNVLIALCLLGVIGMQAGQEYARKSEEREQREIDAKAAREAERIKKDT